MMNMKKQIIVNVPYILMSIFASKLVQGFRLSAGDNLSEKLMNLSQGFDLAFSMLFFNVNDLMLGVLFAVIVKLVVYTKGKNAKKYRHGIEYGSARFGTQKDIEPFIDPKFEENVILTQTESLMMNPRPPSPKYARNKNVLIVGGSGSGKTRFWLKPNLMQMHSSYVVTDPKGYNI